MAMQDAEELNNLFHNVSQEVETFTDKQLVWMQDTTSTSNQQIVFDNSQIMSRATIWKTAFIRIPILWQASIVGRQITVGANTVTIDPYSPGASPIALKCGPASLFSGVQVNLSTGTGILNDQNSPFFLNQLRPKLEMNEDGSETYGAEAGYIPDFFPHAGTPMAPLYYGGPSGIGNNQQKPAFGASLSGVTINGVPIAQDYSVANTAIYNQANEIIENPVVLQAVSATTSAGFVFDGAGHLFSSPVAVTGFTIGNGTYSFQVIPENFTFSSNALVAIQQPATISVTVAADLVSAVSITIPGKGYGTDGTAGGANLLPNLFTATLRVGAVTTTGAVIAAGGGGTVFVFQVDHAIPGLTPNGADPQFSSGYSDLSCRNPFYNSGFQKRIQSWWANTEIAQDANLTGGTGYNTIYRTNVIVRMPNLHDFYRQLDFPIENTRLQTLLTLAAPFNISASGAYFGMHYGPSVVANPPIFRIAQSPTTVGNGVLKQGVENGACTMYLNAVTFPAESAVRLKNALSNPTGGLIKQLSFLEGEITLLKANSTDNTLTSQIQTTSTRVKRVWILGLPVGSNVTLGNTSGSFPNAGFSSQTLSIAQPFAGLVPTARANNCVLRINGQPWRQNPLTNDWEFFDKVREQLLGFGEDDRVGSKVDYIQWLSGVAVMYVFDLQRQGVRPSINDPVLLGVDITRMQDLNVNPAGGKWTSGGGQYSPVDWYCILEKESLVQLNIGTANAAAIKQF